MPPLNTLKVPAATLAVGLLVGLGVGQFQVAGEQKSCQDKLKEKDRKISFIQRKMTEEKAEATGSIEQKCRDDGDRLQAALQGEKKRAGALSAQVSALTGQVQQLDAGIKAADAALAKTKQNLQETQRHNQDLDRDLKKTAGEKQNLQAELKRTTRELGTCTSNNADLAIISQELVRKYKDKGFGSVILEKEPLTQVRKVELEQLTSQYQEEIDQKRITKKQGGGN